MLSERFSKEMNLLPKNDKLSYLLQELLPLPQHQLGTGKFIKEETFKLLP